MELKEKAKMIRKELKQFTGIKFSVRCSSGSAIFVSWEDGVPVNQISPILKKFESIDRCAYTGEILLGGNDYVFPNRDISKESEQKIEKLLGKFEEYHSEVFTEHDRYMMKNYVYSTTDFRKPLKIKQKTQSMVDEMFVGNLGDFPLD